MKVVLEITTGLGSSSLFEYTGKLMFIGRDPASELIFKDNSPQSVSWKHASIELSADGAILRDHESTNGTFVNDRRITLATKLKEGDYVRLGNSGPYLKIKKLDLHNGVVRSGHASKLELGNNQEPDARKEKTEQPPQPAAGVPEIQALPMHRHRNNKDSPLFFSRIRVLIGGIPRSVLWGTGVTLGCVVVLIYYLNRSNPPLPTPPVPEDPKLAQQAHTLLKTHCFKCHGGEETRAGLNILDPISMRKKRKKKLHPPLTPGQPDQSLIWLELHKDTMPPAEDVPEGRPTPTEKEIIRQWIVAGAPEALSQSSGQKRISKTPKDILTAISKHLNHTKPEDRRHQRYFTLTNLYNHPLVKDQDLNLHRVAFAKLINSLTWSQEMVAPKLIDKEMLIFCLDLRDLGWNDPNLMRLLENNYPYGLRHSDDPDPAVEQAAREVYQQTQTFLPYFRVDWFLARASMPPLYEKFLDLPAHVDKLEDRLNVKFKESFKDNTLRRAGFLKGGVSNFNRLLERHKTSHGAYWKSYDFGTNDGLGNIFRLPLGPDFEGNSFGLAFKPAGGEMIFNLPNSLQAYYLTDDKGNFIPVAPENVVRDLSETSGTTRIVNGLSCIHCHREGIIPKDDEILDATVKTLPGPARRKVVELFPEKAKMAKLYTLDAERFQEAVKRATKEFLNDDLGTLEPISYCARTYLKENIGIDDIASELGYPEGRELINTIRTNTKLQQVLGLGPLAEGKKITREQWEGRVLGLSRFQQTAQELNLGVPVR